LHSPPLTSSSASRTNRNRISRNLGRRLTEAEEVGERPSLISDLLHLWLIAGFAHKACYDDVLVYINAVALVYVEKSTSNLLNGYPSIPPTPLALITQTTEDDAKFVTAQEFLLPISLLPDGFVQTAGWSIKKRRSSVLEFIAHPEQHRYGFNTYRYNIGA
jgi:hypothetical protein